MGLCACPTFRHSLLKYLVLLQPIPSTHIFLRKIIPKKDFLVLSHQEYSRYNLRYIGAWSESEKQWCKPISMDIPVYSASFSIQFILFLWFSIVINIYSTTFRIAGTAWVYIFCIGLYLISCLKKPFTHSVPRLYKFSEKYFINSLLVVFLLQDCSHFSIIPIVNKQEYRKYL